MKRFEMDKKAVEIRGSVKDKISKGENEHDTIVAISHDHDRIKRKITIILDIKYTRDIKKCHESWLTTIKKLSFFYYANIDVNRQFNSKY